MYMELRAVYFGVNSGLSAATAIPVPAFIARIRDERKTRTTAVHRHEQTPPNRTKIARGSRRRLRGAVAILRGSIGCSMS